MYALFLSELCFGFSNTNTNYIKIILIHFLLVLYRQEETNNSE